MSSRRAATLGSLAACSALLALSGVPGAQAAAKPVAAASANAVTVTVMGTPIGSGVYRTSNDGTGSAATGSNQPDAAILRGQSLVGSGLLGQDATSRTVDDNGSAWSCAGLAGDDATRTTSGPDCLTPAGSLDVRLGSIDLSGLSIVSGTVMTGLAGTDADAIRPVVSGVVGELRTGLRSGLTSYGTPSVVLRLNAAQSRCTSDTTGTAASTALDGASLRVVAPGQGGDLVLADLPDAPSVAQRVTADLSALPARIDAAIRPDLTAALSTAMGGTPVDTAAVVDNVLRNLGGQLTALDDDLVTADLNRQSRSDVRSIDVTAIDLRVSQALTQLGVSDSRLQVGRATCTSAARTATSAPAATGTGTGAASTTGTRSTKAGAATATVPTKVDAGLGSDPRGPAAVLAAGMLVLGLGAGAVSSHLVGRRRS